MRNQFKKIVSDTIHREGIEELMSYLDYTDFYYAPCSTKFHLCRPGGLLEHSLNVYHNLKMLNDLYEMNYPDETIAIVSLFHDLCKINYYKSVNGKWSVDDQLPLPHGEKSCMILLRYLNLSDEELCAISYHMGGWSNAAKAGDYSYATAQGRYRLVTLLQMADLASTFITEA